ncbi:DNA mismatch repair protein [Chitinophaga parva]|uniref:DNA mismatch repair protein n=1 Tax=Chitinophaga parva TaxID=2169414 RepID=A0A2T7BHN9_9BACT|nr:DNA mismatch repair protein [Chitinophaga parva]PUZ25790.1 DNA mismatch repair protein [Chitinophaga parva]
MAFIADKQTLEDLNLLGKFKPHSIYNLFNKVHTTGGERLLDAMFAQPLTDPEAINARSSIFQYFQQQAFTFPLPTSVFRTAENYLSMGTGTNFPAVFAATFRKKAGAALVHDEQFAALKAGVVAALHILQSLRRFADALRVPEGSAYSNEAASLKTLLADRRLESVWGMGDHAALSFMQLVKYDLLLRHTLRDAVEKILERVYHLDVYIAVSGVAKDRLFSYARALPKTQHRVSTTALRHPALANAVANALSLSAECNLLFLTGANMAGKSTFMKSFGIAIYLAHMGFPVAAENMEFSVRDGLFSSINVPDNLSLGYSHFYAEVLRVKAVAQAVSEGKDLVVIFDELFKGTNVKDAYDATLAVTAAFAAYRNCCFIISTHIIEVGEPLKQQAAGVQFAFLPTVMDGPVPRYPYTLQAGITNDRHGMMIIGNERILEMM